MTLPNRDLWNIEDVFDENDVMGMRIDAELMERLIREGVPSEDDPHLRSSWDGLPSEDDPLVLMQMPAATAVVATALGLKGKGRTDDLGVNVAQVAGILTMWAGRFATAYRRLSTCETAHGDRTAHEEALRISLIRDGDERVRAMAAALLGRLVTPLTPDARREREVRAAEREMAARGGRVH